MTLSLDGSNSGNLGAGVSVMTLALTLSQPSGQAIVLSGTNNASIVSMTAPGLTFAQRQATGSTFGWNNILEWVAPYSAPFSGNVTITFSGTSASVVHAFGIGGSDVTAGVSNPPFDQTPAPFVTNGAPSITTVNANDFVFAAIGGGATDTAGSGWTLLFSTNVGAGFLTSQYRIASATGTFSGATGSGSLADSGGIIDALIQGAGGGGDTFANNGSIKFMRDKVGGLLKPVRKLLVPGWRPEPAFSF